MDGILRQSHDDTAPYTPAADTEPGSIVELPDGRAGIVEGSNKILADETGTARTAGIVEVTKDSASEFADGAVVEWDSGAGIAVIAAHIDGDFVLGKARRGGAGAGDTALFVALNA